MAQNLTFDLPNTTVVAGILKMQVTIDMTGFSNVSGSSWAFSGGALTGTGSAFLTELTTSGMLSFKIAGVAYTETLASIESDTSATPNSVYLDAAVTDLKFLAFPTTNMLIVMDEQVEKVDVKMGVYEYEEFTLEFAEDYSWYVGGFWYTVFRKTAGTPVTFFIRLEESGTDSFVSYGNVNLTSVEFNELALDEPNITSANSKIRTCKLSIVSKIDLLKDVAIVDVVNYIVANRQIAGDVDLPSGVLAGDFVLLKDVVATMIHLAYDQTFDADALQVRSDDIAYEALFYSVSPTIKTDCLFSELYMWADNSDGGGFLDSTSPYYWVNLYPTAFELFNSICITFGYVPRYYYGQVDGTYVGDGSDKHRIEFLTRGKSGNIITMIGSVISSNNTPFSPYVIGNVRATSRTHTDVEDFFYNSAATPSSSDIVEIYREATPDPDPLDIQHVDFDIDVVQDFTIYNDSARAELEWQYGLFIDVPLADPGNGGFVVAASFWNYLTDAEDTYTVPGFASVSVFAVILARYLYYKFKGQATYTRTYSDVRSTVDGLTSQQNTRCLRRHQITDEFGMRTFYAIEVRKSFVKNTTQITWFEE